MDKVIILTEGQIDVFKTNLKMLLVLAQAALKDKPHDVSKFEAQIKSTTEYLDDLRKNQEIGPMDTRCIYYDDHPFRDVIQDFRNLYASWIGRTK